MATKLQLPNVTQSIPSIIWYAQIVGVWIHQKKNQAHTLSQERERKGKTVTTKIISVST